MNPPSSPRIASVAYTHYASDPRVKREARVLAAAGYAVDVYALKEPSLFDPEYPDSIRMEPIGLPRYRGGSSGSYLKSYGLFLAKAAWRLAQAHRRRRYSLIHVHTMPDVMVFSALAPKLSGVPVILDIHDQMPEIYAEKFGVGLGDWRVRLIRLAERVSTGFSNHVITPSWNQARRLQENGVSENKLTVIHNFPDPDIFGELSSLAEKEDPHLFRMVYHGTLARRLGLDIAIRGLAGIQAEMDALGPWRFDIIGAGDAREEWITLAQHLSLGDRVRFSEGVIPVESLPEALRGASLGLVPSRKQLDTDLMLPTKLVEYSYLGIPTVATPTSTLCAYFDSNQVRLVEGSDPARWGQAILELRKDRDARRGLAAEAGAFFLEHTWPREAEKLLATVETIRRR